MAIQTSAGAADATAPASEAVSHFRRTGTILPGTQAEIAAYLTRRRVEVGK